MPRRLSAQLSAAVAFLTLATASFAQTTAPAGFPAEILPAGTTQKELRAYLLSRVRPFELPATATDWENRSRELRSRTLSQVIFRGVPQAWRELPTRVEWQAELPGKGYTIRKLRYQVVPGFWIGGHLYQPDNLKGKVPAILNVNGHESTGLFTDYIQARSINLAKRGLLVLALDWIGTGQLKGPGYAHNNQGYLDLCGVAGVSVMYLELKRGIDILLDQPNTDPERLAVTGMSGGGWQTILISALDTRVKLCAPNAGYTSVAARIENPPDMGDYEQCPPDLSAVADYTWLTAMLAPRPALLIYNDKDQCCFRGDRSRLAVYEPIIPVYGLFGQLDRFAFHMNSDPGTHNYLKDNREAFYRFVRRHFAPDADWNADDIPVEDEVRKQPELEIEYPVDNADFHALARQLVRELPEKFAEADLRRQLQGLLRQPSSTPPVETEPAGPTTPAAGVKARQETFALKVAGQWTLPVLLLVPPEPSGGTDIVLADTGRGELDISAFAPALESGRRVMLVDLLFLGEAGQFDIHRYLWSNLINTVGDRPLGLQVGQLAAVIDWTRARFARDSVRLISHGRMASMAALVYAALNPRRVDTLTTHGLEPSLKRLLEAGAKYEDAPTVFCTGLLKVADVSELVQLAGSGKVTLR
jgi:dienelactone hydrolase